MTDFNEKTFALFSTPTNKKIVLELEKKGARVFQFPPLQTEKTVLDEKTVVAIKNFLEFDWLIFPDVLTVDYFLQSLRENQIDSFEMDLIQVCAVGEAVADRLRFAQAHADVITNSSEDEAVFLALSDYIGQEKLRSLKFLLLKELSRQPKIKERLIESGANVFELAIYQAKIPNAERITKLKVLLKGGAIDEFIISSPVDLIALQNYFENFSLAEILSEVSISAADKNIFQSLKEHNLKSEMFQPK